jgi:HSP20 family protein
MSLVRETDGEYHVRADLPAADAGVRVDDGVLTIAGERKFEKAEQSEKVYRRQSLRSAFSRDLALQDEGG